MNKNQIIMAILAMSLAANQPLVAQKQSPSGLVHRLKKEYQTLSEAFQCAREKGFRACSPAQKKRIVIAGIALAALVLSASYVGYRKITTQLIPRLQDYIDQVRAHLYSTRLETIRYDMSQISALRDTESWKKELNKLLQNVQEALKKAGSLDEYYKNLEGTYVENFSSDTLKPFNIDYKKLYELLGTTDDAGKSLSVQQVKELIDTKIQALQKAGHIKDTTQFLGRQLGYIFRTQEQKDEYDAFLGGQNGLSAIHKKMSGKQLSLLGDKLNEIASIITELPE